MISCSEGDVPRGWDEYVLQHSKASSYHLARWIEASSGAFRLPCFFLCARGHDDTLTGVMPLILQRSRLVGDRLVSLPYFNYGGALANDQIVHSELLRRAAALTTELRVSLLEIREVDAPPADWPLRRDKATLFLDLPPTVDELAKQLGSKLRSQIKRGLRENPVSLRGSIELLGEFYKVFSEVMRDLGTPVYPFRFFKEILNQCAGDCTIIVLRLDGRPVSTAFLVRHHDRLEIPWAATLGKVKSQSINMVLYWELLRFAIENGFRTLDFGRSTIDSGPYRFKLQWGARPIPLHWAFWNPQGIRKDEISNIEGSRFRTAATQLWSRLPLRLANKLGPLISPYLPW